MKEKVNRRGFLQKSILASSAAAALSFEENALLAQNAPAGQAAGQGTPKPFPTGKIGKVSVSRLICGGNLISGFAHSRDLIYVSPSAEEVFHG